jgi:hypothetical protein
MEGLSKQAQRAGSEQLSAGVGALANVGAWRAQRCLGMTTQKLRRLLNAQSLAVSGC